MTVAINCTEQTELIFIKGLIDSSKKFYSLCLSDLLIDGCNITESFKNCTILKLLYLLVVRRLM